MTYDKFVELFGTEKVDAKLFDKVIWIKVNGNEIRMVPEHYLEDNTSLYYPKMQVILVPWVDKEVKAAEESVAKAKEALEAAENALKVLKESK
jgi:hypothetical protein